MTAPEPSAGRHIGGPPGRHVARVPGLRVDAVDSVWPRPRGVRRRSTPSTPSRKVPMQFGARLVSGALAAPRSEPRGSAGGLVAGIVGAVIGTLEGARSARGSPRHSETIIPRPSSRTPRRSRCAAHRGGASMSRFDAIILGTGQAGPPLAGRLTAAGMTVAIVERKLFGGTCVNTGCTPTKTLVASAYAAHLARRGADYGIDLAARSTLTWPGESACRCGRRELAHGVEKSLRGMANCRCSRGTPASRRRTPSAWVTSSDGAAHLHQRRRPRGRARLSRASPKCRISPTRRSWRSTGCLSTS